MESKEIGDCNLAQNVTAIELGKKSARSANIPSSRQNVHILLLYKKN